MKALGIASAVVLFGSAHPALSQERPAFADARELSLAARCSAIEYGLAARRAGWVVTKVKGGASFKRTLVKGSKVAGSVEIPFAAIPLTGEAKVSKSATYTMLNDMNFETDLFDADVQTYCKVKAVSVLDKKGRLASPVSSRLFNFDPNDTIYRQANNVSFSITISQNFTTSKAAGGGAKFNLFGLIKFDLNKNISESSAENAYSYTISMSSRRPR